VLEGRDAFNALEKEWNAAWAKGPRPDPMLRHDWFKAYLDNFAPSATLRTFVVRAGRELHAAMPLVETVEKGADTCFTPLVTWATPSNDQSQRGGILLGRKAEEAVELLWQRLVDEPGWERLRIRELPDGALEWRLRERAESAGYPIGLWVSLRSPVLRLPKAEPAPKDAKVTKLVSPYERIEAALDGKFRQNLRRRKRRLAEKGAVRYVQLDGKQDLETALADFLDIEASGWKGSQGSAIKLKPETVGFYTQIARDAAKRGTLCIGFLELEGKRIAGHLSLIESGTHWLLKIGYDESLREFSPGQQLASFCIEDACRRGLTTFDFLGPCMEWKLDWEPALRTHRWLTIFRPTRKGELVHAARFVVWPVARKVFARLKEGSR
jgi:CelD/BcsL family acetyltransferase involved in cellulose biosynthesis